MAGRGVAVGAGGCGRVVAVGAAPDWVAVGAAPGSVAVGLGGGETEPPAAGMMSCVPTVIMSLLMPLASLMACTVTPNRLAMPLRVSPAWTT